MFAPAGEIKVRIIGLLNWATSSASVSDRFAGFRRFAPYYISRCFASALLNPSIFALS
jgi:hypothetical protein